MQDPRTTRRQVGAIACWLAMLALTGCMLLQPRAVVDFEATPLSGRVPRLVDFTPIVDEEVASYEWNFGDGATSTEAAPAHVYREKGRFTVSLRVQFADGGTAEAVKENLIEIDPALPQAAPGVGELYWIDEDTNEICAGDREGHESRTVVSGVSANYLAVGGGSVYWTTYNEVKQAGLDGIGVKTLRDYVWGYDLHGIAVDPVAGRLYWVARHLEGDWLAKIYTANLDGSAVRVWASDGSWSIVKSYVPWLLAIDPIGGRLYWFERYSAYEPGAVPVSLTRPMTSDDCSVHWSPLSTFQDHLLFGSLPSSSGLALDVGLPGVAARYVYWTNPSADRLTRCKVDGTSYAWLLNNIDTPIGLAIDAYEGKVYWSGRLGIHRANLDGSEQELIYRDVQAVALALDLSW